MVVVQALLLLISTVLTPSLVQSKFLTAFQNPESSRSEKPKMKAWFCDGKTQKNLVEHLRQARIVKSTAVQRVMESVDRCNYVPESYTRNPYADSPQAIGMGQTISAPHMHSYALEEVLPNLLARQKDLLKSGNLTEPIKILDIGCGSGYLTACFGRWFKPLGSDSTFQVPGKVYGMDVYKELVDMTKKNIQKADSDLLEQGIVQLRAGNGWQGWKEEAPFDAIHVGAAASSIPMDLMGQLLTPHGVLVVPVGSQSSVQKLLRIERIAESEVFSMNDFSVTELLHVRYVPLVNGPSEMTP
jgi:protein-L-isoaspartate(D-aspartate) O-methyltransferase